MIRVNGLTKKYGARNAILDLKFHAKKGEIVGFLGPNGAGKTTTMRILAGFMPPTSGEAKVAGFDIVAESLEVRRRVGYLPESVPLYDDMTVYDYLKFMADLYHVEDVENRVWKWLEAVHLEDRGDSFIESLSKGMRQRVGLAQALIHEPEVLILDEPTIGLDPGQILEVRDLIKKVGEERTVLLSTHILSEAQQLCDRVLIINEGQIVAEDTPENLEARLSGARRFVLTVSGDASKLVDVVDAVAGVDNVSLTDEDELAFDLAPGVEARPAVARAVLKAGGDLLELRSLRMSLEEIFLELTQNEAAEDEAVESEEEVVTDA